MKNKIYSQVSYETVSREVLGANSEVIAVGDLVVVVDGTLEAATSSATKVDGVANVSVTLASNNETVGKKTVSYTVKSPSLLVEIDISGGALTSANEGDCFKLVDANTVDGATTPMGTEPLRLVKLLSATRGVFALI